MLNFIKSKSHYSQIKPQNLGLLLVMLTLSLLMGWFLAGGITVQANTTDSIGTVDVVPSQYQLGQDLYLENCATCHIGIPPAVLPTQTWKNLLQDTQHYGVELKTLVDPPRILVWKYLLTFSRLHLKDDTTPYRINDSRFFKALHPGVKLPNPVKMGSCITCHAGAEKYNFRQFSSDGN